MPTQKAVTGFVPREEYEEMKRLAFTDYLTGLPNRRSFDETLKQEMTRARLKNHPLSLALLDLDHFKRINDTYGHPVGDAALMELGKILKRMYRITDSVARVGGEEFAIILPGAYSLEAPVYLERLREEIESELVLHVQNVKVSVTASLGVVEMQPKERSIDLYTRADLALYEAKRNGRNKVVFHAMPA